MNKRILVLLSVFALAMALLAPMGATAATGEPEVPSDVVAAINSAKAPAVYIVQMSDDPAVAYEGGTGNLKATAPKGGKKLNPNSTAVKKYVAYLGAQHDAALNGLDGVAKFYDYAISFNGFAAKMTGAQAVQLAARPGVVRVWPDEIRQLETENSPQFLGLTGGGGLWDSDIVGEDVIVGVIDTGIWPEHPSFSDQIDLAHRPGKSGKGTLAYDPPPTDWYGTCRSGQLFSQDDCNNKLIGARYFTDGFTNNEIKISGDYLSARDTDGHGSHTASTAAGNAGVDATLLGSELGAISGIAPRARIAVYKACWADAGCAGSDLVMAIDQAVADGVDVINYSIGSSATTLAADDIAFLFAADAGVFVATSAGNAGPGASTIGSPAWVPWVTSVGASTQDRTFTSTVTLGNSETYTGAGIGEMDSKKLVDGEDAGDELCNIGALDPGVVAGNIVLCKRGDIPLVEKSQAVLEAGGVGMVLYNLSAAQMTYLTTHAVAAAHISYDDGLLIKAYIDSAGGSATASIDGGNVETQDAPWMVDFSSRGPNGGSMDLIKPDITAPGFGILAAYSPTPFLGGPGELFAVIQGTSMASPHVAGAFALLKEAHPEWSAAAARSALMTTASQDVKKEDGGTPADPFDMGAGHLNPNPAVDPGLVYDAGLFEYLGFLCGNNPQNINPSTCAFLESIGIPFDPSQLNYPSIGVAQLTGTETITRTVTNVGPAGTYQVSVDAPAGVDVSVSPTEITLGTGDTAIYEVTFTVTSAPFDEWAFGSLTWIDGTRSARSPIAVKPVQLDAPAEVIGSGTAGSLSFDVTFGYTGDYAAGAHGLVQARLTEGNVLDDPDNSFVPFGPGTTLHLISVPSNTAYARFSLFDDYTDGEDDLDLYVYDPNGDFAGGSGSGTSAEEVNVVLPDAGVYYVFVHGWQTDGPDSNYTLFDWAVPSTPGGSLRLDDAPASAVLGETGTIEVGWTGLETGKKYLGAVSHSDSGGPFGLTVVNVSTE